MYKSAVVKHGIQYARFTEDFINSHTFHDSPDSASRNDHRVILSRISTFLANEHLVMRYSQKELSEENFVECMEDLLLKPVADTFNDFVDFKCHFCQNAVSIITEAANSIPLFKEHVTQAEMENLFNECRVMSSLTSYNNQHLAYFLCQMDSYGLIARNYQYVIEYNKLILSPKSQKSLTAHNLACALTQINSTSNPIKDKIERFVKRIKLAVIEEGNFLFIDKQ